MAATALGELYLALTCFWASGKTQAAQAKARTAAFPSQLATEAGAEEKSDRIRDRYHRFRDRFAEMTPEANITRLQSECDLFRAALSTARQDASPANLAALTKAVENALAASMAGYDNGPETAKLRDEITAALPAIIDITRSAESAPVRVVILTAIQAETEAVLRHLADRDRQRVSDTWFHTGRFNSWTIAVAEAGPGNAPAATIAARAFAHFNPEIAAFIGVAGGVKDVTIGDVVVATKVYAYESGKETPHGFLPRPEVQKSHHELEQRARVLRSDTMWHRRLDIALWSDRKPHVYIGPIAAGEAVVATDAGRIATLLKRHYSDALAVEMEGRGFLEAAHIESRCRAVVVRGISDLLKGKAKTDKLGGQQRAADAAAAFFFEMLALESGSLPERAGRHAQPATRQPEQGANLAAALGRLRQFHNDCVKRVAGPAPLVPVLDGAILVVHLAPLNTFDAPQPSAFGEICGNPRSFPPIRDTAPRDWRITYDGLFTGSNNDGLQKPQRAYVYVAPSGTLEAVVSSIARGRGGNFIPLPEIQSMIIHYARVYAAALYKFGIQPPLAVFVSLARVKNMRLLQDFIGSAIPEDIPYASLSSEILQFREAIFKTVPPTDNSSAKMLQSILVHLANTAGIATSPYFDSNGNYTLTVACPAG